MFSVCHWQSWWGNNNVYEANATRRLLLGARNIAEGNNNRPLLPLEFAHEIFHYDRWGNRARETLSNLLKPASRKGRDQVGGQAAEVP